jgi:hypothetical protein
MWFILLLIATNLLNFASSKTIEEDVYRLKKFEALFSQNVVQVVPGNLPVPTDDVFDLTLTPAQKNGFLQFWYYSNLLCDNITEIDTIHLRKCLPWWQVDPQTNYAYLTANVTTSVPKQYAVSMHYYNDADCTVVAHDTEIAIFDKQKCHNGYYVTIDGEPPKPKDDGVAFTQYVNKEECTANDLSTTAEMKWLPFDECLYNGQADFAYTSCSSEKITGVYYPTNDGTCNADIAGTFEYDEDDRCELVARKFTNFECLGPKN